MKPVRVDYRAQEQAHTTSLHEPGRSYASAYTVAQKLSKDLNAELYLVGSRGSCSYAERIDCAFETRSSDAASSVLPYPCSANSLCQI